MRVRLPTAAAALTAGLIALAAPAGAQIAPDNPTSGPAAQSLRELVAKYFEFRGPAYGQLQTFHERFYQQAQVGPRQSGNLWMDRDGRMRREVNADGERQIEVATPDGGWRTGEGGKIVDDPTAAERARRRALLEFGDALTGRGGAVVTPGGDTEFMEHGWSVVHISFGDADTYEVLLDPSNGLLCCYRITEGGKARVELFNDWRLVDGVRMPFVQAVRAGGELDMMIGAVELNRPLDGALFAKPAA